MMKATFNILVTDHILTELIATKFLNSMPGSRYDSRGTYVSWRQQPAWSHRPVIPLDFFSFELENSVLNLYHFPSAIKRDFKLADLDIKFDGGLLIVDLGAKELWHRHKNRNHSLVEVKGPESKVSVEEHIYRRFISDDPSKIWGVELINQIDGAKLILGVKSSPDGVPPSYIEKYLPLNSPVDIILHNVNPDTWLDAYDSFPPEVIADTLITMEKLLLLQ